MKINVLTTIKNITLALKNLKDNTFFRNPKSLTDEQIELINDAAYCKEHSKKSNDEIKLLLAQTKYAKLYYRTKIYLKSSYVYQKTSKKFYFIL